MRVYPTQKDRTDQAFSVYLELLETADWLWGWMQGSLETLDLTMTRFRLLVILNRDGVTSRTTAANALRCTRQAVENVAQELEECGWVKRGIVRLQATEGRASQLSKAARGKPRLGPRIGVIRLTPAGKKFIAHAFPKHAKWVKATMRVLNFREQKMLGRLCRKLREGDAWKLYRELQMEEVEGG